MSVEISKRTRSQLAVPDHVLRLPLARSPLKHARVTSRNQLHSESNENKEGEEEMDIKQEEEDENENDEILLSPKKNKRSSDTCPENLLGAAGYREAKRIKIDPLPALSLLSMGHPVENRELTSQSPRKMAKSFVRAATESACHATNGKVKSCAFFSGRARSVPLPTDHVPELDLRTLSPMRSPRKVPNQLKITPIPPPTEAAQTSPLTPLSATDEGALDTEHAMDVDTASAMSHFTNVPKFDLKLPDTTNLIVHVESATPRNLTGYPSHMSLSPLTPLPPTSFISRRPAVPSLFAVAVEKKSKQSQDDISSLNVAGSSTSSAAPSRLPRPSTSASSLMPPPPVPVKRGRSATVGSSHTARSKPIGNLSKGKKTMLPPSGPRRVTRSVSMKEKRPESLDESDAAPEANTINTSLDTDDEPSSVTSSSQALTFKVSNSDSSLVKGFPDPAKFKQTSLASFMKAKPTPSSSTTGPSSSSCVQRPPPSPSRIPLPVSPIKQRAGTSPVKRLSIGGPSIFVPSKPKSSLFTLSTALEKLAMPPPTRPNTSLGFNISSDKGEHTGAVHSVVKDDNVLTGSSGTFARPTASSLKRHATISGSNRISMVGRMKDKSGALGRTATGIFGPGLVRPSLKASRKTSLPSVMASPVKGEGGGTVDGNHITNTTVHVWGAEEDLGQGKQLDVTTPSVPSGSKTSEEQNREADLVIEELVGSADKGKQPERWDSRRASSALHALSRSLSALPKTPPKLVAVGTRSGLRSSSSTYYGALSGAGSGSKSAQAVKDRGKPTEGTDSAASQRNAPSKNDAAASPIEGGSAGKSVLKVLKKCAIFVDVRTDDGDDAGSLFVDMLRGLGARILARVGQSCTHIVYKNGSANTLTRYRLLNDPKPLVVGIAWVVECVEQRSRVDEAKFKVDLEMVNIAGTNKKRRSMLPRHMSPGAGSNLIPANPSSEADDNERQRQPDDGSSSPAQDADISIRSVKDEDDLPPLERARRRRSFLPGGQTRLI